MAKVESWEQAEIIVRVKQPEGARVRPLWEGGGYFTFFVDPYGGDRCHLETIGPRGGRYTFLYLDSGQRQTLKEAF